MFCYIVLSCALFGQVFSQTSLSAADKQTILDEHNRLRGIVSPSAANMQQMAWNDELAQVAQNYADTCNFAHNPNRKSQQNTFSSVGENLYATSGSANYAGGIMSWYNEVADYNFNSNSCSNVCGHYTQVVWATSNSIGCGARRCTNLAGISNGGANWLIFVCNYGPAGNFRGQQPYVAGLSCSQCQSDRPHCVSNTCSATSSNAGTTYTANGGTTDAANDGTIDAANIRITDTVNTGDTSALNATMRTSSDAFFKPIYLLMVFTALSACAFNL